MSNVIEKVKTLSREQFAVLYDISKRLNSASDTASLYADALDLMLDVIDAERGIFAKYKKETGEFELIAARHINKGDIKDLSLFSSGLLRKVIETSEPQLLHDVQGNSLLSSQVSVMLNNIKSVIGIPVFFKGEIWGVIVVDSIENRKFFTKDNLVFLDFVSNVLSLTLNNVSRLEALEDENSALKNNLFKNEGIDGIIGSSEVMQKIIQLVAKVSKTDATVLILGESGTGKDLFAQAIHKLSKRNNAQFVAQFCGSIPDNLLESELFGFKKGSFTGAVADKKGLFEVADKGTFFLDEIADVSAALQAKLLRVIQNKEIIRIGETEVRKVDVRIIAATNKDLKEMIKNGTFREDLFYRLNVFPIVIPPLRERKGDVPLLANHFLKKYSDDQKIRFSKEALKKLELYHFPGNVRQLENIVQRAVIFCNDNLILPGDIDFEDSGSLQDRFENGNMSDFIKDLLLTRLEKNEGNRTLTAKSLGVSVRWIQKKLKELEENGGKMSTKFSDSDE